MDVTPEDEVPTSRDERMAQTREAITRVSRELTAERGFAGYTIEDLCEAVGISRRTFFNYFESKERAVFGPRDEGLDHEAVARFTAAGDPASARLSPTLLDDLVLMSVPMVAAMAYSKKDVRDFAAAVYGEPKLLAHFLRELDERDKNLAAMVAVREGLDLTDPAALLIARLGGEIVRSALQSYLETDDPSDFETLLRDRLRTARDLTTNHEDA